MEAKRHIIVLLTVVAVLGLSVGYAAEEGGAAEGRKLSGTREASCLLKVTCDPAVFPLSVNTLDYLMRTSGVAGKAGREVLGLSAIEAGDCFMLEEVSLRGRPGGYGMGGEDMMQRMMMAEMMGMGPAGMMMDTGMEEMMIATGMDEMMEGPREERGMEVADEYDYGMLVEEGRRGLYDEMMDGRDSKTAPVDPAQSPYSSRRRTTSSSRTPGSSTPGASTSRYSTRSRSTSQLGAEPLGSYYSNSSSRRARGDSSAGSYSDYGHSGGAAADTYGAPGPARATGTAAGRPQTTLLVELGVELPEDAAAAAEEFMEALVGYLQFALENARSRHWEHIMNSILKPAEKELAYARDDLAEAMGVSPPDSRTYQVLENETVDLSWITPDLAFSDAIEMIRQSVDPPLQIVVMWRDLAEIVPIEQTTPVEMDGPSEVRLGAGLELLLKAMGGFEDNQLGYEVRDNVIVIAAKGSLPSLDEEVESTVESEMHKKVLYDEKAGLVRDRRATEMDVAAMEARQKAIYQQIDELQEKAELMIKEDQVLSELEQLVKMSEDRVIAMERLFKNGTASAAEVGEVKEKLALAKVELGKHKGQLSRSAGGTRIASLNDELTTMSIDLAERQAYLQIINARLDEVEKKLAAASIASAQSRRVQFARQQVEIAERRVAEVKALAGNIAEPSVVVIGAD